MALYLGSNKVSASIAQNTNSVNNGINCVRGTVISDSQGVVTFPELDFTPSLITVWNITRVENGDGVNDVLYLYEGLMLMAINNNGYWISQGVTDNSGEVHITNATAMAGTGEFFPENASSGISVNGNIYSYQLGRVSSVANTYDNDSYFDLTNKVFNYAIYG